MERSRYVGGLLWVMSLGLILLASLATVFDTPEFTHKSELGKVQESLAAMSESQSGPHADELTALHNTLALLRSDSQLIDERLILVWSMLSLMSFGLASVLVMGLGEVPLPFIRPRSSRRRKQELIEDFSGPLEETLEQLQRVSLELSQLSQVSLKGEPARSPEMLANRFDELLRIQGRLSGLQRELGFTLSTLKEVAEHLQSLSRQCEENAQFTAATRLEWSSMGSKLRMLRDQHNKVKSTAEKVSKQQLSLCEMIGKSLEYGNVQDKHATGAREHIHKMNEISRSTLSTLDLLAGSMAESNQDVGAASALVRGLSERAEEIVNIIDVIDDIAEQTNQLALNASIEAARAGEQGQGFAVVAGEVRNLAARSSTATKSITDLLGTIQQEADHASSCLEKTSKSVGLAHTKTLEVDRSYREGVHLARQAMNGLQLLIANAAEQTAELKAVERQAHDLKKYNRNVLAQLEEQGRISTSACGDSTSLMQHSDRLSRLLSRQYFEITHCDSMVDASIQNLRGIKEGMEDSVAQSESLRGAVQQLYIQSLHIVPQTEGGDSKLTRAVATLQACSKNLEIIKASPERARGEMEAMYKNIIPLATADGAPLHDLNIEELNKSSEAKAG